MIDKKLLSEFFEKELRVEAIHHLGLQCAFESFPSDLHDLFFNDQAVWDALGLAYPEHDCLDEEEITELLVLNNKNGFLVEFAMPIPKNPRLYDGQLGFESSWGLYRTQWFYAETYEETLSLGYQWSCDLLAKVKAECGSPA